MIDNVVTSHVGKRRRFLPGVSAFGLVGFVLLGLLLMIAVIGPLLISEPRSDVDALALGPTPGHPLGTDFSGRDNLALVVRGARPMLQLAIIAGLATSAIAVVVGATGGMLGGWIDWVLVQLTDLWLTVPRFILLIVVASLIDLQSTTKLALLIALFGWPILARQIRAQVLSLRRREFIEAAGMLRLGFLRTAIFEMLPNMAPYLVITAIQGMTQAVYQQVGLAFLGLVALTDNWATLFSLAYRQSALYSTDAAWSLFVPVAAVTIMQLALVFTSRGLEEVFNPRLRGQR